MTKEKYVIEENIPLTKDIYKMVLLGDTSAITAPGQFINIELEGLYLRRPISICDYDEKSITIIYKVVGKGTQKMSEMTTGEQLDILVGLGNGYKIENCGERPLVIGGGVGIPPLYHLTKKLIEAGKKPVVILGYNCSEELFYVQEFEALGAAVFTATVDGSCGTRGFVTDVIDQVGDYTYFFTCGPEPMLKAVYAKTNTSGQFSFEERMGCGFGACMGCSCKTIHGSKRICKEGPVLEKEEILW